MPGIEQQDHNPWIEQQLQTNRRVKEHRHCTQQRIAERHANKSSQQPATDCGQRDEEYGLASTPALCEYLIVSCIRMQFDGGPNLRQRMPYADDNQD